MYGGGPDGGASGPSAWDAANDTSTNNSILVSFHNPAGVADSTVLIRHVPNYNNFTLSVGFGSPHFAPLSPVLSEPPSPCKCLAALNHYRSFGGPNGESECSLCPKNSNIPPEFFVHAPYKAESHDRSDCKCEAGFIRTPKDEDLPLVGCRLPADCMIIPYLDEVTAVDVDRLHWGTCGTNQTTRQPTEKLNHLGSCTLRCSKLHDPEDPDNVVQRVGLSVTCLDGEITGPTANILCSKMARSRPVMIFFTVVALAAVTAGLRGSSPVFISTHWSSRAFF